MGHLLFYFIFCFLTVITSSCSNDSTQQKLLSRINNYELTLDEFQEQLTVELEINDTFKLTTETKRKFLEELIQKELLIQEAKILKLDQQKKFIRAIEKYWELTLIRDLIDIKNREISKKITISEEEAREHYQKMKKENPDLADFKAMASEIKKKLKENKKSILLHEWIVSLREKANVEIYPSQL